MPLFSARGQSSELKPTSQPTPAGGVGRPRRIYSEKEIEDMIMSLPRDLQVKALGVYQRIGKLEATTALHSLKQAREDIQELDRELQTMKNEEADQLRQAAADPASFHAIARFRRPTRQVESQQLKVEDETELN